MPKLKPHRSTKKRVRITKTGKVLRRHSMGNHFLEKKSASNKRRFAGVDEITGKTARNIRRNLGV